MTPILQPIRSFPDLKPVSQNDIYNVKMRFDVVSILKERDKSLSIELIKNAFDLVEKIA